MPARRHLSYAQGYLELGLVAEAAAELDRLSSADRNSTEAVALRMAVLQEQQKWPELAALAADFVGRTPEEPAAWVTWAYAVRRTDTLAAAEAILRKAERMHPGEPTIQFNLGCYACVRGDLVEARRRVDRAIELDAKFRNTAATDPDLAALRAAT
ncbi:MAG TPA: hypothetical protein VHE61_19985 [Opitutaceae bacterium]|nr:hypothetical protein [Opitutaceae bacterium]